MAAYYDNPEAIRPPSPPPNPPRLSLKSRQQAPQQTVRQYWSTFNTKHPGKITTVLPNNPYAQKTAANLPKGVVPAHPAAKSYEQARAECIRDVTRIVTECTRNNQKYRDPHFDIEWDLKSHRRNCLDGLMTAAASNVEPRRPKGVKRVPAVFENPQFYINGPTAGDVRQGGQGDCYLMAALCGLGNMEGLIDKICVAQYQDIGVYGFVFFRDGEWQPCIIDDKLYLRFPDYEEAQEERDVWDDITRKDTEEEYRRTNQTGSRALYFAQCEDENETWLPLLEKAYAKAHGDYSAIDGGFTGEAVEDLTGGVTSEIYSSDILDKDKFWNEGLMQVGKEFLFGCGTGFYSNWLNQSEDPQSRTRRGIYEGHAYSVVAAREVKGQRLVKVRNPWGQKEWEGKWSDGSSEWNAEWIQLLDHKFGDDGTFWISYEDLLRKYQHFDRTRIFGPEWHVTQTWTSLEIPWSADYHSTRFRLTLAEKGAVVIVLAQLDDTYFKGLEGMYRFELQFRLEHEKENGNDYIVRSNAAYAMARSVSTDIELEAGTYMVLMKITATRSGRVEVEDVLPTFAANRREKFLQIGLSYDLAHAKGAFVESKEEKAERVKREKTKKAAEREKLKKALREQAYKDWVKRKAWHERDKKRQEKKRRADERREARGMSPRREEDAGSMDARQGGSVNGHNELEDVATQEHVDGPSAEQDKQQEVQQSSSEAETQQQDAPTDSTTNSVVEPLESVIAGMDTKSDALPSNTESTSTVQISGVDAVTNLTPLPVRPRISSSEDAAPPTDVPVSDPPQSMTNRNLTPPTNGDDADAESDIASDLDSFESFDWRTDLDMSECPSSSSTSSTNDDPRPQRSNSPAPSSTPSNSPEGSDSDPWNAICVLGVRVYSKLPGDKLLLEVVRPGINQDGEEEKVMEKTLDRDDPRKGMVVEGPEGGDDKDGDENANKEKKGKEEGNMEGQLGKHKYDEGLREFEVRMGEGSRESQVSEKTKQREEKDSNSK